MASLLKTTFLMYKSDHKAFKLFSCIYWSKDYYNFHIVKITLSRAKDESDSKNFQFKCCCSQKFYWFTFQKFFYKVNLNTYNYECIVICMHCLYWENVAPRQQPWRNSKRQCMRKAYSKRILKFLLKKCKLMLNFR